MDEGFWSTMRVGGGVGLLLALLGYDLWRYGWRSRRLVEYGFLVAVLCLAAAYCLVFDMVTSTISPEYFWWGKEVGRSGRSFLAGVAATALGAAWPVGLLLGAAFLIANSLGSQPPHAVRRLYAFLLSPVACSLVAALLSGALFAFDPFAERQELPNWSRTMQTRFLIVQGIHLGAYLGGLAGTAYAVRRIFRSRRSLGCNVAERERDDPAGSQHD
jgi:hypothetical protein